MVSATFGQFPPAGSIFGVIVRLPAPGAMPSGSPFDSSVMASTLFNPGYPSVDFLTPLSVTLEPGDYGLIFGTGRFGSPEFSHGGIMIDNNEGIPGNSYFFWNGRAWGTLNHDGLRFVVRGNFVETPNRGVQFSRPTFNVTEGCVPATLTVTLTDGGSPGPVTVDYTVNEGTASQKSDYTFVSGTLLPQSSGSAVPQVEQSGEAFVSGRLEFLPGETEKEVTVLITDDGFAEGTENLTVTLSNPRGAQLGSAATATLDINDNETVTSQTNPIDNPATFVCQLYHDFLHRQPDPVGHAFWTEGITRCGADPACVARQRHDVAIAFFLSIEFQQTSYFIYRAYETGLDRRPVYEEFMRDLNATGLGVEVGIGDWQQRLAAQRSSFAESLVGRADFKAIFPAGMSAGQFADKLFANAGVSPTQDERQAVVSAYGAGDAQGRAAALAAAVNSGSVFNRLYNPGLVLVEYFGFLRRDPDDLPDQNLDGYFFWLAKLDDFSRTGDDVRDTRAALERIRRAELVRAFILSSEYRQRFGN